MIIALQFYNTIIICIQNKTYWHYHIERHLENDQGTKVVICMTQHRKCFGNQFYDYIFSIHLYIVQCPIEYLSHTVQTFILWNHIICAYTCFSFSYITYKNKWQKSKILMPKGFFYCVTYSWNIFIEWICTVPTANKFQINAILYKFSINIIIY